MNLNDYDFARPGPAPHSFAAQVSSNPGQNRDSPAPLRLRGSCGNPLRARSVQASLKTATTLLNMGLCLLLLVSCNQVTPTPTFQTSPTDTPTSIALVQAPPTATATATATPKPTYTATPTDTPEPTATATATVTPKPSRTATPTDTPELTPTSTPLATPTTIPFTPTPTAAAVVPAPPPAAPPAGDNLMANPGFEDGANGWIGYRSGNAQIFSLSDYPQFIRSGQNAAFGFASQLVFGVTPGVTYRLGAWGRAWSSPNEDRSISENPGDIAMHVCINTAGDDRVELDTTVCSASGNPIDTWQYFSVDAVATSDRITVMLHAWLPQAPRHNDTFWDDVFLGLAPVGATPTPTPTPAVAPVRPAPVPFDGVALRDGMAHLQWVLEQMGGLLDRVYNGEYGSCPEFEDYYRQTVEIPTYHSIPGEWQGVYNEYIWSADNVVATNEAVYLLCQAGGGRISELNYGIARSGIHDTLARLIPAIVNANALLGQ